VRKCSIHVVTRTNGALRSTVSNVKRHPCFSQSLRHELNVLHGLVGKAAEPPTWIKPQLTRNVDEVPAGNDWLHEIKYDGYRMHARLDAR
jgi:ATP-dependent DNA ligase